MIYQQPLSSCFFQNILRPFVRENMLHSPIHSAINMNSHSFTDKSHTSPFPQVTGAFFSLTLLDGSRVYSAWVKWHGFSRSFFLSLSLPKRGRCSRAPVARVYLRGGLWTLQLLGFRFIVRLFGCFGETSPAKSSYLFLVFQQPMRMIWSCQPLLSPNGFAGSVDEIYIDPYKKQWVFAEKTSNKSSEGLPP